MAAGHGRIVGLDNLTICIGVPIILCTLSSAVTTSIGGVHLMLSYMAHITSMMILLLSQHSTAAAATHC